MLPGHVSCHSLFKRSHTLCRPLEYRQPLCQFVSNCSIKPIYCNRSRVVDVGNIMALLRRIRSCWLQIIIQEADLENTPVPKSLHTSMASFFVFDYGLTSLALGWRIPSMFNSRSFIHTWWIVLWHLGNHRHQWWSSSHLLMITSMTGNQVIPCSTSNPFIHMVRIMSFGMRNWRPWDVIICHSWYSGGDVVVCIVT